MSDRTGKGSISSDPVPSRSDSRSPCAVCGYDRYRYRRRLSGAETVVRECVRCGFVFCVPLPTVESRSSADGVVHTDEVFTRNALSQAHSRGERYTQLARARHKQYAARLGRAHYRLLEIGCGTAGLALELRRLGVEYYGIDLDERMVSHARDLGIQSVECTEFFSYPIEKPFDVILFSQVLEHITHPARFIERVHRSLGPGGVVHLDVPNHGSLAGCFKRGGADRPRYGGIHWSHHAMAYQCSTLHHLLDESFDVEVLRANPDHPVWGQATVPSRTRKMFFLLARLLGRESLLVAVGTKRSRL